MKNDLDTKYLTLHEFIEEAHRKLDANGWDYLTGGTETETTLCRNRQAIDHIALRPRVLQDVSNIDATKTLFGKTLRLPVMFAPVGGLETFDPDAALTVAKAAGKFGCPMMMSSVTQRTMQEVRDANASAAIYQLYVRGDAAWVDQQVEDAIAAGFDAFCFTVDTAVYSRRERDIVKRFDKPWRAYVDEQAVRSQAALSWDTIARIKDKYDIPLILKGIGTAEDTEIAIQHGVDVVYVSNHGGRQLDHGRGSFDVLPEVVEAASGKAQIWVDGGFSRGTDIVKAFAMGADLVGVGRLYCYAMAADGQDGIVRMMEILENEIHSALGLTGVTSFAELTPAHVHHNASSVVAPGVHSAFPLLDLDGRPST